jgi:isopentenyl diphosphate isomerase/L-lactate dehydrogenase-like FMN-dependent dehydrogenase
MTEHDQSRSFRRFRRKPDRGTVAGMTEQSVGASRPVNIAEYEALAAERLPEGTLGYYAGGAGDERTLRDNVAGYGRWQLRPRVLVDVSEISTATTVLGTPIAAPIIVAPVALLRMAHPDGEPGMARAAAAAETVFCLSTLATSRPSEVAQQAPAGAPRWFQLYCLSDRGVTRTLLDEAVEHDFQAIVLTVDAPRGGRRERDLRTGFAVPADVEMPAVRAAVGGPTSPTPAEFFSLVDTSLTWRDLEQLVADSPLPVIVKGIQTAEDAHLACEHGAAAVVVSNHGGRQLDGVAATIDMLPEVVDAVAGRMEVLVDGGIRRGTDVLVALALGARAVLVGRPCLWGLTVGGEAGARHVLDLLREELELGLMLLGCPSPADVTRRHVLRADLRN